MMMTLDSVRLRPCGSAVGPAGAVAGPSGRSVTAAPAAPAGDDAVPNEIGIDPNGADEAGADEAGADEPGADGTGAESAGWSDPPKSIDKPPNGLAGVTPGSSAGGREPL